MLPLGVDYEEWCAFHAPVLEQLLHVFDGEQRDWEAYEARCVAAVEARAQGLDVPDPVPPSPADSVFACIRMYAAVMSSERRAQTALACAARRRPMPPSSGSIVEFVAWIVGEVMARGVGCDLETAHQLWFVLAESLLRDADIGAIVARAHPERVGLRPDDLDPVDEHKLNIDLARQERKRVNQKREAFGYSVE